MKITELLSKLDDDEPAIVAEVVAFTAKCFGVKPRDIIGPRRHKHLCAARHVATFMVAEVMGASSVSVGAWLGRDHSTALHSFELVRRALEDGDERITAAVAAIRDEFRTRRGAHAFRFACSAPHELCAGEVAG